MKEKLCLLVLCICCLYLGILNLVCRCNMNIPVIVYEILFSYKVIRDVRFCVCVC
jgi:hypothetical protein